MRTQNLLLLIGLSLLFTSKTNAQTNQTQNDVTIHIYAERLQQKRSMYINRHLDEIKIVYSASDSINRFSLRDDKEYQKFSDRYMAQMKANHIDNKTSDSLRIFFDRHRTFDRDSITFNVKTDTAYNNLLNRIINATDEELMQQKKNAGIIILDGTVINFKITNGSDKRSVYANSPNAESHPLLYDLSKSTSRISVEKNLKVKVSFWH